jgi:hypothetical protein
MSIIILPGCRDEEKSTPKVFPQIRHIEAAVLPFHFIIDRRSGAVINDCPVFLSSEKADTLIHIFSLPDIGRIEKFGTIGNAPDEFISPSIVRTDSDILCVSGNNNPYLLKMIPCFFILKIIRRRQI